MNWQNFPNHDERATRLKECIVPKLDTFLFADYQSMEWRIFGFYIAAYPSIRDASIVKEILRGDDPYFNTAEMILGRTPTKDERTRYKRGTLSILYNGTHKTILEQGLADTEDEAIDIVAAIHEARPQIAQLKAVTQSLMKQRGYVKTLWGRQSTGKTHTKDGRFIKPERRPMVNYLIQGTASDIMKDALLNVDEFLNHNLCTSHLVLTIHDEIGLDCAEEEVPAIVEALPQLMGNRQVEEYLPLGLDIAIARESWADEKEYESLANEGYVPVVALDGGDSRPQEPAATATGTDISTDLPWD